MVRRRVRIRFCKEGDLRFIGHRDLVRVWERVFRRAGIGLRMSEGFRPKPRMHFPSALAVGICGADEVMESELNDEVKAAGLHATLQQHTPPGLVVKAVEVLSLAATAAQVQRVVLELPIPAQQWAELSRRITDLLASSSLVCDRGDGRKPVDLRKYVEDVRLTDGVLRMQLRVTRQGSVRPREVLEALELEDLKQHGFYLTRTAVELET